MDELRNTNPNPSIDQYERELDYKLRQFCIEQTVAVVATDKIKVESVVSHSKLLYDWIKGKDDQQV